MAGKSKTPPSVRKFLAEAGKKGGRARKIALSDKQRTEIAQKAARTRWKVGDAFVALVPCPRCGERIRERIEAVENDGTMRVRDEHACARVEEWPKDIPVLDAKVIEQPLDDLLVATANKLEREWPASLPGESAVCLRGLVLASRNTFRTIRYFCADKTPDPARRLEYSLSAAPLARLILEAVFNTAFLLEDLPARTEWFMKAGWRAMWEDLERFKVAYGADPAWSAYLKQFGDHVDSGRIFFRLTDTEFADPAKKIPRWPPRRKMRERAAPELAAYLQYLGDWFYKNLSEDAHLTWNGIVRLSGALLNSTEDPEITDRLMKKQRSDAIATAVILQLALVSEIVIALKLDLPKLKYLWGVVNEFFLAGKEVYVRRYEGKL